MSEQAKYQFPKFPKALTFSLAATAIFTLSIPSLNLPVNAQSSTENRIGLTEAEIEEIRKLCSSTRRNSVNNYILENNGNGWKEKEGGPIPGNIEATCARGNSIVDNSTTLSIKMFTQNGVREVYRTPPPKTINN